jgi:hypothetical protein
MADCVVTNICFHGIGVPQRSLDQGGIAIG